MQAIANLLFVVAGSFLSGYASLVLDRLPSERRVMLGAAGLVGFVIVVTQIPFRGDATGVLVSGGYAAIASAHAAIQVLSMRRNVAPREVGTVAGWTLASVAVMAGLLWWVAGAAPSA